MNFSLPQNLSCIITTNTDVNTTKLDNIVNVIWWNQKNKKTRNILSKFSNNYRVHSITSVGAKIFESKVEFKEVRASMAGQYACVAWIVKERHRQSRDFTDVLVKCKCDTNIFFIYITAVSNMQY